MGETDGKTVVRERLRAYLSGVRVWDTPDDVPTAWDARDVLEDWLGEQAAEIKDLREQVWEAMNARDVALAELKAKEAGDANQH